MRSKKIEQCSDDINSDAIFNVLKYNNKPMDIESLLKNSNISCNNLKQLKSLLIKLVHVHKVVELPDGQWTAAVNVPTLIGYYSVLRSGSGLVKPVEDKSKPVAKNKHTNREMTNSYIYVQSHHVADAWPGDLVRVAISSNHQKTNKRIQGYIVEVIEKKHNTFVVEVEFYAQNFFTCKSTDSRIKAQFQVDVSALATPPQIKELLEVKITERIANNLWSAQAITNFGREDNIHAQENLVKLNHHVPNIFPESVLKEAEKFGQEPSEKEIGARTDLRHIPFVTIDGDSAKDFDDAIHVEKIDKKFILHVGIADVSHYVHSNSALDKEAQIRGNSWYFPSSVEPMLPHALSSELCSLKPDKNRLTLVAKMVFSETGEIIDSSFYSAVIRSAARLRYTDVEQIINHTNPEDLGDSSNLDLEDSPQKSEIISMLEMACELAKKLMGIRAKRGSLDFELPEPEYYFSKNNTILDIKQKKKLFSHKLIEEFMVATNEVVARTLGKSKTPFLYRVHPEPTAAKLADFFQTVQTTGLLIEHSNELSLPEILKSVQNSPKEFLISRLALRTMAQALYQPENEGHFGLASVSYCHFTSPIRRYADIVVHRALKYLLGFSTEPIPTNDNLLNLGPSLNRLERSAMEAEREISRRLGVLFLKNHIGKSFTGIIASVTDFGIFIELDQIPVTGMIHLSALNDDYYEYRPERQELIGIRKGIIFALGQKVQIFVKDINLNRLEINFAFNNNDKVSYKTPKALVKKAKKSKPIKKNIKDTSNYNGKKVRQTSRKRKSHNS